MTDAQAHQAAPGWYPDTTMTGTQRYWDGTAWTEHAAPLAPAQQDNRMPGQSLPTPVLMVLVGVAVVVVFAVIAVIAADQPNAEACATLRSISMDATC